MELPLWLFLYVLISLFSQALSEAVDTVAVLV